MTKNSMNAGCCSFKVFPQNQKLSHYIIPSSTSPPFVPYSTTSFFLSGNKDISKLFITLPHVPSDADFLLHQLLV